MSSLPISVPQAHQLRQELLRVCDKDMLVTLLQTLEINLGDVGAWDRDRLAHQLIQFAAEAVEEVLVLPVQVGVAGLLRMDTAGVFAPD